MHRIILPWTAQDTIQLYELNLFCMNYLYSASTIIVYFILYINWVWLIISSAATLSFRVCLSACWGIFLSPLSFYYPTLVPIPLFLSVLIDILLLGCCSRFSCTLKWNSQLAKKRYPHPLHLPHFLPTYYLNELTN